MKEALCYNCGAVLDERGYHLCRNASFISAKKCEYCGETTIDPRHICKPMYSSLKFSCADCGRLAVEKQFLCKPNPIG